MNNNHKFSDIYFGGHGINKYYINVYEDKVITNLSNAYINFNTLSDVNLTIKFRVIILR